MNTANRRNIKSHPDADELREHRFQAGNNLRKRRRADDQSKHRNISDEDIDGILDEIIDDVEMIDMNNNNVASSSIKVEIVTRIYSNYVMDQLAAVDAISKILWRKPNRSIDVITLGLVPRFFQLLRNGKDKKLQVN